MQLLYDKKNAEVFKKDIKPRKYRNQNDIKHKRNKEVINLTKFNVRTKQRHRDTSKQNALKSIYLLTLHG